MAGKRKQEQQQKNGGLFRNVMLELMYVFNRRKSDLAAFYCYQNQIKLLMC